MENTEMKTEMKILLKLETDGKSIKTDLNIVGASEGIAVLGAMKRVENMLLEEKE